MRRSDFATAALVCARVRAGFNVLFVDCSCYQRGWRCTIAAPHCFSPTNTCNRYSGFENIEPATADPGELPTNSLAAYRIHEPDPLLFTRSFTLQWIASSDNGHHNGGFCNYDWPPAEMPSTPPLANLNGTISVDSLAWIYVWDE